MDEPVAAERASHSAQLTTIHLLSFRPTRMIRAVIPVLGGNRTLSGRTGAGFARWCATSSEGTFSARHPRPRTWMLIANWPDAAAAATFERSAIARRWRSACSETLLLQLRPLHSRGTWSGLAPFGPIAPVIASPRQWTGPVVAITHARVRAVARRAFAKAVPSVATRLSTDPGFTFGLGFGETPLRQQGTLSAWTTSAALEHFAYRTPEHQAAIAGNRKSRWFVEELFARFALVGSQGTFGGHNPLGIGGTG
jgi:hypothetical protein